MFKRNITAGPQHRALLMLLMLALLAGCTNPLGTNNSTSNTANPTATTGAASGSAQAPNQVGASGTPGSAGSSSGQGPTTSGASAGASGTGSQSFPEQQAIIDVVNRARPAVVTVVNKIASTQGGYGGEALGTGMIVDTQGHIFTNNHVIEGSSPGGLSVIFANGDNAPATLIGADNVSDVAVLKIDRQITATVQLGNSDQLQVGQISIAIGSALGDFKNTVTTGVVSGLNRTLPGATGTDIEPMVQTDAAINHGNSGGPLFDLNGNVIGMNTAVVTGTPNGTDIAQGLGFAIPINTVKTVTAQLMSTGNIARPYLGVATRPISPQLSSYYDLRDPNGNLLTNGELVVQVQTGSGAEKAGLQPGDVITSVDNATIDSTHPLQNILLNHKPGDKVQLKVVRNGKELTVSATLGTRPAGQSSGGGGGTTPGSSPTP